MNPYTEISSDESLGWNNSLHLKNIGLMNAYAEIKVYI